METRKLVYGSATVLFLVGLVLIRYVRVNDENLPGWVWAVWLLLFLPLLALDLRSRRSGAGKRSHAAGPER
ncbi:hypothetical protein ACQEU3_05665 [Spirillospora sp. CA-253888]